MRIAMIGSGYVGLVSGPCFAAFGHNVVCIDKDSAKIASLKEGRIPIYEPGLAELVADGVATGRLSFSDNLAEAIRGADVAFIAVGTPSRRGDGHADLRFVYAAAREIAAHADGPLVIVTKSTVPVGTGDQIEAIVADVASPHSIHVVSNPEFLKEGAAINDFMHPDRIVVGTQNEEAQAAMHRLYAPLADQGAPLLTMDRRGAEMTKYAANALLATKITFINEIANLCEAAGTDVASVAQGVGLDTRIGRAFLAAGPGYGGSCFPKDTMALIKTANDFGTPQRIVEAVVASNEQRKRALGWRIVRELGDARGKTAAVLGLTFKANTDDTRDSPALAIIAALQDAGVAIRAFDPQGMAQARPLLEDVTLVDDPYEAAIDADVVVVATEWPEFAELDLSRLQSGMRGRLFADLRNLFPVMALDQAGFNHFGVGRPFQRNDGRDASSAHGVVVSEAPAQRTMA